MADDDPLSELYSDDSPYDRARLADELGSHVRVHPESGEPVRQQGFGSLMPNEQIVTLLLYRKVATELGEIDPDDEPAQMAWLEQHTNVTDPDFADFPFQLEFVDATDGESALLVPDYEVGAALDFLTLSS